MKWFVRKSPLHENNKKIIEVGLKPLEIGWGNGYLVVPPAHPWYGVDYENIDIDVHGGLTFGAIITEDTLKIWNDPNLDEADLGKYLIGFATGHYSDNELRWPKEAVEIEAQRMAQQAMKQFKFLF